MLLKLSIMLFLTATLSFSGIGPSDSPSIHIQQEDRVSVHIPTEIVHSGDSFPIMVDIFTPEARNVSISIIPNWGYNETYEYLEPAYDQHFEVFWVVFPRSLVGEGNVSVYLDNVLESEGSVAWDRRYFGLPESISYISTKYNYWEGMTLSTSGSFHQNGTIFYENIAAESYQDRYPYPFNTTTSGSSELDVSWEVFLENITTISTMMTYYGEYYPSTDGPEDSKYLTLNWSNVSKTVALSNTLYAIYGATNETRELGNIIENALEEVIIQYLSEVETELDTEASTSPLDAFSLSIFPIWVIVIHIRKKKEKQFHQ